MNLINFQIQRKVLLKKAGKCLSIAYAKFFLFPVYSANKPILFVNFVRIRYRDQERI